MIRYKDRQIDLAPYFEGFPYKGIAWGSYTVDLKAGKVFYRKIEGGEEFVHALDWTSGSMDLSKGKRVSSVGFTQRNLWGVKASLVTKAVYFQGDENNDEIFNLYQGLTDGSLQKLTDVSYIYGWSLSPDGRWIAYVGRRGPQESSPSDVHVLNLETFEDRVVYSDDSSLRLTWDNPAWSSSQDALAVSALKDGDRERTQVLWIPLKQQVQPRVLTDLSRKREITLVERVAGDLFFYASNETGRWQFYSVGMDGRSKRITDEAENYFEYSGGVIEWNGKSYFTGVVMTPSQSTLKVIDPTTGREVAQLKIPEYLQILDRHQNRMVLQTSSITNPLTIAEWVFDGTSLKPSSQDQARIQYPEQVLKQIVHCNAEKVNFPTFDGLSAPGESGGLHGYLLTPKNPQSGSERKVVIEAFYGGVNRYFPEEHLLCQAGISYFSPSPRGSWEWGKEFQRMIVGDLGGNEMLDVIAAGKYVAKRLGVQPSQVGLIGASHGGYAVMRLMTFPGEVNGVMDQFDWGFGVANYGMSNILTAYSQSNIPGWTEQLCGENPNQNPEKWLQRSPETFAHLLKGPLLLTHGGNDKRVPVDESRRMYRKLQELSKPVHYLELEGQGHGYKGREALTRYYAELLSFLDSVN